MKHALTGGEAGALASRAGAARATLETARDAVARLVELIEEAQRHLDHEHFDPRRAGVSLELLRAARAAADATLREAQEQADLTLDAFFDTARDPRSRSLDDDANAAEERRPSGFQVPPAPARPAQRPRPGSGSLPAQQRKPTS